MHKKSCVGSVSDADCVHRRKPLWLLNAASGQRPFHRFFAQSLAEGNSNGFTIRSLRSPCQIVSS